MNCQRRRSGPSFEVDAAPTPIRDGPEASPKQTGASRGGEPGTSPEPAEAGTAAPSAGAPRTIRFRRRAPDECFRQRGTIRTIRSPATARRAIVIGLQPAANGRGCGLCV